MSRSKALFFLLLLAAFSFSSCSGPLKKIVCTVNCGSGNLSFTMVADHLPAHPSILSFTVTVLGVVVTSSTSTMTLSPPNTRIDLMRLQSDSALLGTLNNVPGETISSLTVGLAAHQLTFLNDTGVALTSPSACAINAICTFDVSATVTSVLINNVNQAFSGNAGIGLDFNLANAISVTGTTLTVNFKNSGTTNVLTSFLLPRTGSNLASGQLDLIEDFTGVVSLNSQKATITSLTHGTLAATATSSTNFDTDPSGTLCPTSTKQTLSTCVSNNQVASMDAVLNSDGTLSIQEIEPLLATQQDIVEGVVTAIATANQTQFTILTTDKLETATGTLIGPLNVGDFLTVTLVNPKNFLIDAKGLTLTVCCSGNLGNFTNTNNTTALHPGQTVTVHVTGGFTAANGSTPAMANSDTVTLRWTRFTATVSTAATPAFTINSFPSFFSAPVSAQVQFFGTTQGTDGTTNLDGISSTANLVVSNPVAMRALYIENPGLTLAPAFYAAKVRQH
ncbi:MAG TPA: hypothetical protein VFN26_07790 [Candidatus Acidoferrum sp.]|nr:hypothetical protein [Candidatus Acidoferrum sp.]